MNILKKILMGFGVLIVAVVALVMLIWLFPQTVINTKTVKWAVGKQTAIQFEPEFPQDFDIQVRNSKLVRQRISIHATQFCVQTEDKSVKACFDELDVSTVINFKKFSLIFDSIGPITLISPSIEYVSSGKKNDQDDEDKKGKTIIPEFSNDFKLEPILIAAPNVSVDLGKTKMKAFIDLQGKPSGENAPYLLDFIAKIDSTSDPKKIDVKLSTTVEKSSEVMGTLVATVGSDGKSPRVALDTKFDGNLIKAKGKLIGNVQATQLAPMLPSVDIYKFKIEKDEKLTVEGDFRTELMIGHLNEPKKSALPPPKFKTKLSGRIEAERSGDQPVQFNVKIDPSKQYGLEAVAKTKGQYNLKSAQLDLETLLLDVKIEDFRETIRGLRNTQMAIPAPINDLRGKISLLVGSEKLEKMRDGKFNIPIQFKTDLTAAKQSLVTEAKGAAIIQPTPFEGSIDVDFNLNDVAIRLPDFDPISKFPTVVGDSRFVTKEERVSRKEVFKEEKKEPSNFKMNISIDTPQKPIRILYHLFKPAAVFRVKTKIRERGTDFNVNFEPFDVSYLKRTAHLERLKITNDDEAESIALNGRFSIKKSDYTIYVDIEQVAKKSYVTLSSEPPLSEDDIVSLILFNELASELDSTSNDSVQDTQAAMTKKTIGFLSFFALASTPIESVNYDPTTQQYSARVKLPGGFTGTVGSDWENSQQVGIRRRLGGKFVISAGVGTDTEGGQRQETMLEWYHRY